MPRIARKSCIRLYDVGNDGLAKAVLVDEDGEESVVLERDSFAELRKVIYDFKREKNLMQVRVEMYRGQEYQRNSPHLHEKQRRVPVAKRFSMAAEIIEMVLKDYVHSVVLCGQGGCGKSYTVLDLLHAAGYDSAPGARLFYKHVRGSLSPMELYKFLYNHRRDIIVFDDADAVFQTETSTNILKAVLDTTGARTVAWYSGALNADDDEAPIPHEFTFEGKIIFISNRVMDRIPDPIRSRALLLDLSFTREELMSRMRELAERMCPYLTTEQRAELLDHIEENIHVFKNLSLRTLAKAGKIVEAGVSDWKETVLFAG